MTSLGVLIDTLENSDLSYLAIKQGNELDIDFTVYYNNCMGCIIKPKFKICPMIECYHSKGVLVATDLRTSRILQKVPNNSRKLFYVYELDFTGNNNFLENIQGYNNIDLVTPSEEYRKELKNYANKDSHVVEMLNLREIYDYAIRSNK